MRTLEAEQARALRLMVIPQIVPVAVAVGAIVAMVLEFTFHFAPIITLVLAFLAQLGSAAGAITLAFRSEVTLHRRLADVGTVAATEGESLGRWAAVPAVLTRARPVMSLSGRSPLELHGRLQGRIGIFVALVGLSQTRLVAVPLPPAGHSPHHNGARLRLSPTDPAVAVIDPFATPADHAAAADMPALTGLSRAALGRTYTTPQRLAALFAGLGAFAISCVVNLLLMRTL